jgi:hypothetical protein
MKISSSFQSFRVPALWAAMASVPLLVSSCKNLGGGGEADPYDPYAGYPADGGYGAPQGGYGAPQGGYGQPPAGGGYDPGYGQAPAPPQYPQYPQYPQQPAQPSYTPPPAYTPPPSSGGGVVGGRTHTVAPGENLYRISRQYGTTVAAISSANGITNPDRISVGQVLVIP